MWDYSKLQTLLLDHIEFKKSSSYFWISAGFFYWWQVLHFWAPSNCFKAIICVKATLYKWFVLLLCSWFLIRKAIWYVANCRIYEYYVIFIYFQAAVSALCCLSQFCTLKKNRNRLREYLRIRKFDTYQTVFLMRNQGHR